MVDPSSEQKRVRYDRLLADANEVFDLWWLNEELTERLFNESKFGFNGFVSWHRSWYEDAELYFASQYLLSYHDAQCEIAAIVDEEMPRDYYEERLKEDLWAFVSMELGKAWRATKQTDEAENRTHRWKVSAKYIFSQHRLGHRGKRHGLVYSKRKEGASDMDPITAFCEHVKNIVKAFAQHNGEVINTNAKGVAGQYTFDVDADSFCLMMNELRTNYDYRLNDYLKGRDAEGAKQMTLVCPFIGHALSLNIINTPQLQKTDLEPVLLRFYPGSKSIKNKLSFRSGLPAEEHLFSMVETLLKQYRKK